MAKAKRELPQALRENADRLKRGEPLHSTKKKPPKATNKTAVKDFPNPKKKGGGSNGKRKQAR